MSLGEEVAKFKAWAAAYPVAQRSGEWECAYAGWDALHAAALAFLAASRPKAWSEAEVGDLLYAIARDNEIEYLVEKVAEHPDTLLALARLAVSSPERDARWQLADRLGSLAERPEAEALLLRFADDADEYVSRRALLALGRLKSPRCEALAERAWQTGHEHQRMAALEVLKEIASPKLPEYVQKAMEDGREYLVANARQVSS